MRPVKIIFHAGGGRSLHKHIAVEPLMRAGGVKYESGMLLAVYSSSFVQAIHTVSRTQCDSK